MNYQTKCRKQIVTGQSNCDDQNHKSTEADIFLRLKWTNEEDKQLFTYVTLFGHKWLLVAQKMEFRNASQCCQRWKRLKQIQGLHQNKAKRWTQNEDQTLLRIYQQLGPCWNAIAKQIQNKTGKQVRRRYKNYLDPNLNHGPMTEQEDEMIYQEYLKYGSQWSKISQKMPGRSENMIKNRFYSFIKQKYLNQPNLYFKVKPLEDDQEEECSHVVELSQNIQNQNDPQDNNEEVQNSYSNEIDEINQSSYYWSVETRCFLFKKF